MSTTTRLPLAVAAVAAVLGHAGLAAAATVTPNSPIVVRGPYIQLSTSTSVNIRWRTDVATDSAIWIGPAPGSLSLATSQSGTLQTEHELTLNGLTPATRYYYAVGDVSGFLAGNDSGHYFETAPVPGTAGQSRVWVLGDSGMANQAARDVRDAYLGFTAGTHTDLVLMLGDNAYDDGTDAEFQAAVFDTYPTVLNKASLWPTFGNHDAVSAGSTNQTGPYYDSFTLPANAEAGGTASGTEAYYSFDWGDIHFICLNSQDVDRSVSGPMLTWLQADLAATTQRWIVAYFHYPVYSRGTTDTDVPGTGGGRVFDMRQNALPILEAGGVDLVMCGHSHNYERSLLIDGHYGTSNTLTPSMVLDLGNGIASSDGSYVKPSARAPHEGTVYVVAGSSAIRGGSAFDHPVMYAGMREYGSLVLDFDDDRLDATFIDDAGLIRDTFTIQKGLQRSLTRVEPRIPVTMGGSQVLNLDAGPAFAGQLYFVAGSFGSTPGFSLNGVQVPLNPDPYMGLTLTLSNTSAYMQTAGTLDGNGRAQASINFPPKASWSIHAGLMLHHAYLVYDGLNFTFASNPVRLILDP